MDPPVRGGDSRLVVQGGRQANGYQVKVSFVKQIRKARVSGAAVLSGQFLRGGEIGVRHRPEDSPFHFPENFGVKTPDVSAPGNSHSDPVHFYPLFPLSSVGIIELFPKPGWFWEQHDFPGMLLLRGSLVSQDGFQQQGCPAAIFQVHLFRICGSLIIAV
jgi:hypothetical protein